MPAVQKGINRRVGATICTYAGRVDIGNVLWSRSLPVVLSFAVGSLLGSLFKRENHPDYNLEKLIAIGLLLAGVGVLLNLMLKSNTGFSF